MKLNEKDISSIQKAIAVTIKEFRGVGPKSHSFSWDENEFKIIINGTLTAVEKYMFSTFGQEYLDAVYKFYYQTIPKAIDRLDEILLRKYQFELIKWDPDFFKDCMKITLKIPNKVV